MVPGDRIRRNAGLRSRPPSGRLPHRRARNNRADGYDHRGAAGGAREERPAGLSAHGARRPRTEAEHDMSRGVDPIKAEVIARFLLATAEEMGATLTRTAFSPNIKERADCSTAVFDAKGEVIALAQRVPIHLGSMVGAVAEILKRYPAAGIEPGFVGKRIVAHVANIAHHADVGGMVPGSEAAVCKSIYQEGIRIPPVR